MARAEAVGILIAGYGNVFAGDVLLLFADVAAMKKAAPEGRLHQCLRLARVYWLVWPEVCAKSRPRRLKRAFCSPVSEP